jgi:hypothetical protein
MSDNTLLILGTFSLNLAILGGASYYLHSDYMSRLSEDNIAMNAIVSSQTTMTDSLLSLNSTTIKNRASIDTAGSNIRSLSNVLVSSMEPEKTVRALSNLIVGNSNDGVNSVTISGYSGNSKLMFGSATTMSAAQINASGDFGISIANTNSIYIKSADGSVGIKNSSPAYPLDVTGNINTSGNLNAEQLCLRNGTTPVCITGQQLRNLVPATV